MINDKVTNAKIQLLHPEIRQKATDAYIEIQDRLESKKRICRYYDTTRTPEDQNAKYALGRTVKNPVGIRPDRPMGAIVTMARAWQSYHNFALAIDAGLIVDLDGNGSYETLKYEGDYDKDGIDDFMEVVWVMKAHGFEWAGEWKTFKEFPHFQFTFGFTVAELYSRIKAGLVDKQGFVKI